jgi:predicted Zn-dependent protease
LTAERGHYLAPFARILLAIAYVREKDKVRARQLLISLRDEFPKNPLFEQEIARLATRPVSGN